MSVEGLSEEPSTGILSLLYVRQHTYKWGEKGATDVLHFSVDNALPKCLTVHRNQGIKGATQFYPRSSALAASYLDVGCL